MDNSHHIIVDMLEMLFVAEHRRLDANLLKLHNANKSAWGKQGDGFIYQGVFFVPKGTPKGRRTNLPLHARLQGEGDAYMADQRVIEEDAKWISQLLFRLMDSCHTGQDVRDAVPECISDTLPEVYRSLDRIRTPSYFILNEMDLKLYNRVLPRIEFYSATRLLY